jgi:hypothetical protein
MRQKVPNNYRSENCFSFVVSKLVLFLTFGDYRLETVSWAERAEQAARLGTRMGAVPDGYA